MAVMLHMAIAGCDMRHQIARLSHRYEGCFGGYASELTIYETGGKVMAVLGGFGEKKHAIQLSKEQLDYFYSFASELKNLKEESGCTSVEYYRLVMNGDVFTLEDGSCDWEGYSKLSKKFFGPAPGEIIQSSNF